MDGHEGPKEIGVGPEFLGWLTDPVKNGGGALFDFGCYGANLMTWLMDNERPRAVTAVHPAVQAGRVPARRRRGDDPRGVRGRAGDHPGVVELAVQPEGLRGVRRAGLRDQHRAGGLRVRLPGAKEEARTPAALPADEQRSVSYLVAVVRGRVKPSGRSSLENNLDRHRDPRGGARVGERPNEDRRAPACGVGRRLRRHRFMTASSDPPCVGLH